MTAKRKSSAAKPAPRAAAKAKPQAKAAPRGGQAPSGEAEALRLQLAERDAQLAVQAAQVEMLLAKLRVVREVTRVSAGDFSLDEMLELFMDVVLQATRTDAGSLLLLNGDRQRLEFKVVRGSAAAQLKGKSMPAQEGICGWVVRTGESVITEDAQRDSRFSPRMAAETGYMPRNIVAVPLRGREGVLGVVEMINRSDGRAFTHDDLAALEGLAAQMGTVVENAQLFRANRQEIRRLTSLIEISQVLNSTLDLKRLLKKVMELTAATLDAEASSILLKDEATGDLTFEVATGEAGDAIKLIRVPMGEGIAGWVAKNGESLLVPDVASDPRFFRKADEKTKFTTRDILAVPLTVQGRLVGVVEALNKREGTFSSDDLRVLEALAHQSAIAIDNARLVEDLQASFVGTVRCLAQAIDAKDPYTAGHASRVTEYAVAVGEEMALPARELNTLRLSALMHDVGKIGVPESVLCKPGRLTDAEFAQMKRHSDVGAKILEPIAQLKAVVPGVRMHHEHFDGRGYPDGLAGEAIALAGRIIGVCDTFDAMTSDRVYRPRLSDETALAELDRCRGSQFDPQVVTAFRAAYGKGRIKTQPAQG